MGAIHAALNTIDEVAHEGDLVADRPSEPLALDALADPVVLPDGKRIYPPRLHGRPVDELACALLDINQPARSTFLRLTGPPGAGKSQLARAVAYRLWTGRGRPVADRHGSPFYGFVEITGGPSSDEYLFRHEFVPAADDAGTVRLVDSAFVRGDARGLGGDGRRGQHDPRRRPAQRQRRLRRPPHPLPPRHRRDGDRAARVRRDAGVQRGAGRRHRHPRRVALPVPRRTGGDLELGGARPPRRARAAGGEAAALDRRRIAGDDGLAWTPQFRDIEALWRMIGRVGERAALAFFTSNLLEQVQAGKLQDGRGGGGVPDARPGRLRAPEGLRDRRRAEPARLPARGDDMTARPASGLFATQLQRAAAQRGRLDPLYQDLSDHWTRILQRLYPVWALIGPGLSDPGHIELHSRQIYLDADRLLGPREQLLAGTLEPRAVLRCFGVALHETFHAKHTKRWALEHELELAASRDPADRQLAEDRRLLEEPRMEAHGVREHAPGTVRGRFVRRALQAAVIDVILPAFADEVLAAALAGRPLTRDMAARASVYLQARTHYRIVDPAALDGLRALWGRVLGEADLRALDGLFARLIWIPDGSLDELDQAAREYRAIVGAARPAARRRAPAPRRRAPTRPRAPAAPTSDGNQPAAGSLAEALEHALAESRDGQLEQLDEDLDLQRVLKQAAERDTRTPERRGSGTGGRRAGCPTAASTAPRSPTRSRRRAATPPGCGAR